LTIQASQDSTNDWLLTSLSRQNLQNDFQPLSACPVFQRTVVKNLSPTLDPRSRLF
jgi:hypothetical protein